MEESPILKIEEAVREREVAPARKLIHAYLRKEKKLSAKIEAAEWFRRLGLYREGYLLIAPKTWNFAKAEEDEEYARQLLWSAYFLHLQGATGYAVYILDRLKLQTADAFRIAGNIRMSAYDSAAALQAFDGYFRRNPAEDYAGKMLRISRIDALIGMRRYDEALVDLKKIEADPSERLLRGILFQVRGECLAHMGKYSEAISELDRALEYFPGKDRTVDSAFLEKWRGFALAKLGRGQEARSAFAFALTILSNPEFRPEMILDCWYRMGLVGVFDAGVDEATWRSIGVYPGLPKGFLDREGIVSERWLGDPGARIALLSARDEWVFEGQRRIGLPKEILLLAHVRAADRLGLSAERVKPLLWPEEVGAFIQLDQRLAKLGQRLRQEYGVSIRMEAGKLLLEGDEYAKVSLEYSRKPLPWTLLEKKARFEMKEFSEYYGLGRTMSFKLISDSVEAGKLAKFSSGRNVFYGAP